MLVWDGERVKILIVKPETLEDYTVEENWMEYHELNHNMMVGGFV